MNNNTYFTLNDNFEKIIRNTLNDKEIVKRLVKSL